MSIRTLILAAATTGSLALLTAGSAASADDATAKTQLDSMCDERGGLTVWSPYAIARCQDARANKGFDTERSICEGLADGEFVVTTNARHMNRATWACIATSPAR